MVNKATIKKYGNPTFNYGDKVKCTMSDNEYLTVNGISHNGNTYMYSFAETDMSCGQNYLSAYQSPDEISKNMIGHITKLMGHNQTKIDGYKADFAKSFTYAVKWYTEPLYKLEWENDHLKAIVDSDTPKELIEHYSDMFMRNILNGKYMNNSTSVMHNVAFAWELEVQASLVKYFKDIQK